MSDSYDKPASARKFAGARRLLIATIGAATVNYTGCGSEDTMTLVANLMAAPFMPPQDGEAGRAAPPQESHPRGPADPQQAPAGDADQDGGVGGRDLGSQR